MLDRKLSILTAVLAAGVLALPTFAQPGNDNCADATPVIGPSTSFGDTSSSSNDGTGACGLSADSADVWFRLTNTTAARAMYDVDLFGSGYDTVLVAFSDCGGTELACNDDTQGLLSMIEVTVDAGASVLIRVAGFAGNTGSFTLNISAPMGAPPPVTNDDCTSATVINPGTSVTSTNRGALPGGQSGCSFNDTLDVWFRFTAPIAGEYQFDTFGSELLLGGLTDTTLAVFAGCGGTQLACNDDEESGEHAGLSAVNVNLTAGQQVFIRVAAFNGRSGAFVLNADGGVPAPPPPSNDNCLAATLIGSLPFSSGDIAVGGAGDDIDVSCNDDTALSTQNGIWFRYTAPSDQLVRIRENSATNAVFAVFTGGCAGLTQATCSQFESTVFPMTAGTQYLVLVGAFGATPLRISAQLNLSITEVTAPQNDTCATARFIQSFPFAEEIDGTTAGPDQDISCNEDTNIESRFGVWYSLVSNESGTIMLTENSFNGVAVTLFDGPCASLNELACSDFGFLGPIGITAGTSYHILVSTWSADFSPTEPYSVAFDFTPLPGACCVGGSCTIVRDRDACTALGGDWRGVGVTCGGPTQYTITTSNSAFQDISASGTLLATAGDCDDCGERTPIGFIFNFLGTAQTDVWVCSNGYLQFGDDEDIAFFNQPIPNADQPNNIICPLWDDLQPGIQGDIFTLTEGVAPNRRFIVSWVNVTEFAVDPPDSQNFQVVLFEGSNNIEFRYGAIVPDSGGDYSVGFENATGTGGTAIEASDLGSGDTARLLTAGGVQPGPCGAAAAGACCNRTQCSVLAQSACTGPATRFVGSGTACNAVGNFTAPCCRADVGQNNLVSVQDIFDYLDLWFGNNPAADFDQFPGVTVGDVFSYLTAWFARGC